MRKTPALLLVAVLVAGCGGGSSAGTGSDKTAATTTGAPDAQTVTVGMGDDLKFHPSTVAARRGSVSFDVANTGQVPHNLIFDDKGLGGTKTVDGKSAVTLKVSFPTAGTFTFQCTFHPGMTGKVVVK